MIANKFPNLDKAIKFIRTNWVYLFTAFTISSNSAAVSFLGFKTPFGVLLGNA